MILFFLICQNTCVHAESFKVCKYKLVNVYIVIHVSIIPFCYLIIYCFLITKCHSYIYFSSKQYMHAMKHDRKPRLA